MKKASLLLSLAIILNIGAMAQRSRVNNPVKDRKTLIEEASATSQTTQPTETPKLLLSGYFMESFEGTFPPAGWSKIQPAGRQGWGQCANGTTPLSGLGEGTQTVPSGGGLKVAFCSWLTGFTPNGYYQYLITPQFTVAANDSLKFSLFRYGDFIDSVEVLISTTTANEASFNTVLAAFQSFDVTENTWENHAIDLSAFAGQNIYIAFKEHVLDDDTAEVAGAYFALDRVSMGNNSSILDAAVSTIDLNAKLLQNNYNPTATIVNEGGGNQTFDVTMTINPGNYTSTKTVTALASGTYEQITFDAWDANQLSGNFNVKVFTSFTDDSNNNNDTVTKTCNIIAFQNKAFVFVSYDWSSPMIPLRTAIYDLADSSKVWVLKEDFDVNSYPIIMGGAWTNKHWYGTNENEEFVEIDTTTGDIAIIGSMGYFIRDIAYDNATSTMYGISQGISPGPSSLYTINTTTGVATPVASTGLFGFNTLACKDGVLYATNIATDKFYTIDKTTAVPTEIGDLGFNSNSYAQGLDFDPNGNLFMSALNEPDSNTQIGELRCINLTTGNANFLHQFMGGFGYTNNITGFVIPGSNWQSGLGVNDASVEGSLITVYPNPANDVVYLISPDQISSYKIMSISGQLVKQEETNASTVSVNTSELKNGFYIVQIETEKGFTTKKINIAR